MTLLAAYCIYDDNDDDDDDDDGDGDDDDDDDDDNGDDGDDDDDDDDDNLEGGGKESTLQGTVRVEPRFAPRDCFRVIRHRGASDKIEMMIVIVMILENDYGLLSCHIKSITVCLKRYQL